MFIPFSSGDDLNSIQAILTTNLLTEIYKGGGVADNQIVHFANA